MNDRENLQPPAMLHAIEKETATSGFTMASDQQTGSLLRTLASTKPSGVFLELGTGTGLSTAWILAGMDSTATLTTVDNDASVQAIARRHLGRDARVAFHTMDGAAFLVTLRGRQFDFIFADTWPGKYDHLEEALQLLKPGGLYIIDDMLPQSNWPEGHAEKASLLLATLEKREDLHVTKLSWATGILIATRKA